jgi:hypothetical protein
MRYGRKTIFEKTQKGGPLPNFGSKNFFFRFQSKMTENGEKTANINFFINSGNFMDSTGGLKNKKGKNFM